MWKGRYREDRNKPKKLSEMHKITTYTPDQKRSSFAFFILNKGMNSGKRANEVSGRKPSWPRPSPGPTLPKATRPGTVARRI